MEADMQRSTIALPQHWIFVVVSMALSVENHFDCIAGYPPAFLQPSLMGLSGQICYLYTLWVMLKVSAPSKTDEAHSGE